MKHKGDPKIGYILAASMGAAVAMSPPTAANGQPVQRFRKELIRVGSWVHPDTGQDIEVTPERIDHWVAQFARMKADGVKVPVPSDHSNAAKDQRGWVVEMFREGDSLIGLLEVTGQDAILEAARNDVSVQILDLTQTTAGGLKEYPDAIGHVALTPVPVITGMKGMVAISASRGTVNVPVFRLSTGATNMEALKKVASAMGITVAEDATEESVLAAILSSIEASKKTSEVEAAKAKETAAALSLARTELAKHTPAKYDAMTLELSRENRTNKIDALVNAGKITPAVADALKVTWCPADDAALSLSLGQNGTFKDTLAALDKNDPKVLGEQTKAQHTLSRQTPGKSGPITGAEAQAAAAALMGTIGIKAA